MLSVKIRAFNQKSTVQTIAENGFSVKLLYPRICNFIDFYTAVPYIPPYQGGFVYTYMITLFDCYLYSFNGIAYYSLAALVL